MLPLRVSLKTLWGRSSWWADSSPHSSRPLSLPPASTLSSSWSSTSFTSGWPFGSPTWVNGFNRTPTEMTQMTGVYDWVYLVSTATWGDFQTVSSLQKSQRPTSSMRTGWPWRCSCSSLSTTTRPASTWPSSKANLWVIPVTTRICLGNGANWGTRRWVFSSLIGPE